MPTIDWSDKRSITDMVFGAGDPVITQQMREFFGALGAVIADDIPALGCTGLFVELTKRNVADPIKQAAWVRENMGGAGIGLTCYVGPDRFCLVHNTIGGLDTGQEQRHAEAVQSVSRELTPQEAGHVKYVEAARRTRGKGSLDRMITTMDQLSGQEMPKDVEMVDDEPLLSSPPDAGAFAPPIVDPTAVMEGGNGANGHDQLPEDWLTASDVPEESAGEQRRRILAEQPLAMEAGAALLETTLKALAIAAEYGASEAVIDELLAPFGNIPAVAAIKALALPAAMSQSRGPNWTCPEHAKPFWPCRYCAAERLVAGPYLPKYLIATGIVPNEIDASTLTAVEDANEIDKAVAEFDKHNAPQAVALYAKVQTWRRRLAADE